MVSWTIAPAVVTDLEAHAREARPAECCGVLIGTPGRVTESRRAANLSSDPHRFELDPQDHVRAIRDARGRGVAVIGFYHSHAAASPFPSAVDLAESSYPGALYLIVGFPANGERSAMRAFLLSPNGYDEVALQVAD